jgi:hypothetical protein
MFPAPGAGLRNIAEPSLREMDMRWKLAGAALLALGTFVGTGSVAEARDGCGPGFHRNFYGFCRPNFFGPRFYGPVAYRPFYRPYVYRRAFYGPRFYRPFYRPAFYGPGFYHRPFYRPAFYGPRYGWHGGW